MAKEAQCKCGYNHAYTRTKLPLTMKDGKFIAHEDRKKLQVYCPECGKEGTLKNTVFGARKAWSREQLNVRDKP